MVWQRRGSSACITTCKGSSLPERARRISSKLGMLGRGNRDLRGRGEGECREEAHRGHWRDNRGFQGFPVRFVVATGTLETLLTFGEDQYNLGENGILGLSSLNGVHWEDDGIPMESHL